MCMYVWYNITMQKRKYENPNDRFYKGDLCQICSKAITIKNKSSKCRSCKMLGNRNTLGRKVSAQQKRFLSETRQSERNPNWRGDNVGNGALHSWVKRHLKKSEWCDMCGLEPPRDLANKGVYNRDFNNWEWLCRRCHMLSDGRLERFKTLHKHA